MVRESEMAERIMFHDAMVRPRHGSIQNLRDELHQIGFLKCFLKDFGQVPWRIGNDTNDQDIVILHAFRSGIGTLIYSLATWIVSLNSFNPTYQPTYYYMAWITALMWISLSISMSWAIVTSEGSVTALKTALASKLIVALIIMVILLRALTVNIPWLLLFLLFGIPLILYCGIYGGFVGEAIRYKFHQPELPRGPLVVDQSVPQGGFRVEVLS